MARSWLAAVVVAVAAAGVTPATGAQLPILRSATAQDRHVVVEVSVGDLRPVQLSAATRPAVAADGALIQRNVRLQETIRLDPSATGTARWQSQGTLPPGTYFVQVMAVDTGGVTDCPRFLRFCLDHWSSVRRVVVARSG